jgi:hypothetical protein
MMAALLDELRRAHSWRRRRRRRREEVSVREGGKTHETRVALLAEVTD